GFEWTLLCLSGHAGLRLAGAAQRRGLPLAVVSVDNGEARDLYGADLALIRPDQIVAWRGSQDDDAEAIFDRLTGHG
ncbi:MAG TPA: hypothetical protein VHG88_02315, partial [Burkholderiales bacterium]|nr:hypothetical protein [Burkholderiales bacterium]